MGIDLPLEAEPHLRAVLESQPVVLSRVGKDGTLLAVNAAGLSMLGADTLEQVLGTSLMNMVPTDERKACQAFLDRAMGGQRGSFEVDLVGLTGSRHTFELHGSAHPGAPDGIASVLISFRDVTESRRLEQSLVEAAARQAEQEAAHETERKRLVADVELARKAQGDQVAADEQLTELERRVAEANDERVAMQHAHADELARLQEALAEQRRQADTQSAAFARLDGNDQQLADLRGRYDALESERQQLLETAGLLRSEAEARQQTVAELTERLEGLEAERQHAVDTSNSLRHDLDERYTFVADLTTRLQLVESDQQQTTEASAQLRRELESRTALANELAGRIETLEAEQVSLRAEADAELAELRSTAEAEQAAIRAEAEAERAAFRSAFDADRSAVEAERAELRSAADAEQARLRTALEEAHAAIRGELESKLQELQARYSMDTGALRDALNESLSEQARLAEVMAAAEDDAAEKGTQLASLEQTLADERSAHDSRLAELEVSAATRLTELEASAATRQAELEAANAVSQAERDSAEAAAAARTAERDAIHATQIAELEAAHASRLVELEAAVTQASQRADDALAAVQRAEDAFGAERLRLEDALLMAVDGERAAKHALSTEIASRTVAERGQRQMQQAIERFAKEAGVTVSVGGSAPAPMKVTTTTKALADRLNAELPRRLGDGLTLQLLAASADVSVAVDEGVAINAIGAFADSRRLSMLGGNVTVEVAEVTIDEGVGQARAMSPGRYALIALNIDGSGAQQGFPQEIFDSADPRAWREVKEDVQAARAAIIAAGGQVWLTREGSSIMIVEFYLPRGGTR